MERWDALPTVTLPPLAKAEGMTTHDYAFLRLRQAIMVGAFRPGTSLTIRGLAQALDSSSTPVREALRQLISIGALQLLENRRIQVPLVTATLFEELIALRITLEQHAAERAVAHITERQIDGLVEMDHAIDHAILRRDKVGALLANQAFHRAIYTASPERVALPMIESLWLRLGPILGIAMEHVAELYVVDRHQEIILALRKRDRAATAAAIGADIREGIGGLDPSTITALLDTARRQGSGSRAATELVPA